MNKLFTLYWTNLSNKLNDSLMTSEIIYCFAVFVSIYSSFILLLMSTLLCLMHLLILLNPLRINELLYIHIEMEALPFKTSSICEIYQSSFYKCYWIIKGNKQRILITLCIWAFFLQQYIGVEILENTNINMFQKEELANILRLRFLTSSQ